jgi:hypothetical protein
LAGFVARKPFSAETWIGLCQAPLWGVLAAAENALARLDEHLRSSPIREVFVGRTHFQDACASLWLTGELVTLEDLVLHGAQMDIRSPVYELTRAQAVPRASLGRRGRTGHEARRVYPPFAAMAGKRAGRGKI